MQAMKKKLRIPVLDKIDAILKQNCRECIHANSNSTSNEECQGCPWLKELRACGTELGWPEDNDRQTPNQRKKRR